MSNNCSLEIRLTDQEKKKTLDNIIGLLQNELSDNYDLEDFMKFIYNAYLSKGKAPVLALAYVKLIPSGILNVYGANEEFTKRFDASGLSLDIINQLKLKFDSVDGLSEVASYVSESQDVISIANINSVNEELALQEEIKKNEDNKSVKALEELSKSYIKNQTIVLQLSDLKRDISLYDRTIDPSNDVQILLGQENKASNYRVIPHNIFNISSTVNITAPYLVKLPNSSKWEEGFKPYYYIKQGKVIFTDMAYMLPGTESNPKLSNIPDDNIALKKASDNPSFNRETTNINVERPNILLNNLYEAAIRSVVSNLYVSGTPLMFDKKVKVIIVKEKNNYYSTFAFEDDTEILFNTDTFDISNKTGQSKKTNPFNLSSFGIDSKVKLSDLVKQDELGIDVIDDTVFNNSKTNVYSTVVIELSKVYNIKGTFKNEQTKEVDSIIKSQLLDLYKTFKYLENKEVGYKESFNIVGGSYGTVIRKDDKNDYTLLSDIDFKVNNVEIPFNYTINNNGEVTIQHQTATLNIPVTIERKELTFDSKYAQNITKLLTEKVTDSSDKVLVNSEIKDIIETFINIKASSGFQLTIKDNNLLLTVNFQSFILKRNNNNDFIFEQVIGNKIEKINKEKFVEALQKYFNGLHGNPKTDKEEDLSDLQIENYKNKPYSFSEGKFLLQGKVVSESQLKVNDVFKFNDKFYVIEKAKLHIKESVRNFMINDFEINDQNQIIDNVISYRSFIKNNFTLPFYTSIDNKVKFYNPYITFENKTILEVKPDEDEDLLSELLGLDKNNTQKALENQLGSDLKQYEERANKWFANHPAARMASDIWKMNDMRSIMNMEKVAEFNRAGVTLYMGSDSTDLYHEAWHIFTQTLLTKEQQDKLYSEARKLPGVFKTHTGSFVKFSKASDLELEEYLAEDFRKYMLTGKGEFVKAPAKKDIFRKIKDLLIELFKNLTTIDLAKGQSSVPYLYNMYEQLNTGKGPLFEQPFSWNNFKRFDSLAYEGPKTYQTDNQKQENILLGGSSVEILSSMDYYFSAVVNNTEINYSSATKTFTKDQLQAIINKYNNLPSDTDEQKIYKDKIYNSIVNLEPVIGKQNYEGNFLTYINDPEKLKKAYQIVKSDLELLRSLTNLQLKNTSTNTDAYSLLLNKFQELSLAIDNFGNLDNILDNLNSSKGGLINYHIRKSNIIPLKAKDLLEEKSKEAAKQPVKENLTQEEQDAIEAEKREQGFSEYADRTGIDKSTQELAFEEIQFMLGTMIDYDIKEDRKVLKVNRYGTPKFIPFNIAWNKAITATQNNLDFDKMYQNIIKRGDKDLTNIFGQIAERLGGIDEIGSDVERFKLQTRFWQSFNKSYIKLLQVNLKRTELGEDVTGWEVTAGKSYGQTSKLKSLWRDNFKTKESIYSIDVKRNDQTYTTKVLNLSQIFKNFNSLDKVKENPISFLHSLGVYVSNTSLIKDSIKLGDSQIGLSQDNLKTILTKISKLKNNNLTVDEFWKESDSENIVDLSYLFENYAKLEATYGETNLSFMVLNAEGETQFEHSLNNELTIITNTINEVNTYQELITLPWMSHFDIKRNPDAKRSIVLKSLFEEITDENGLKTFGNKLKESNFQNAANVKLDLQNLSGTAIYDDEEFSKGIALASADPTTKRVSDIALAIKLGIFELPRHSDKSTSYSYSLTKVLGSNSRAYIDLDTFIKDKNTGTQTFTNILIGYLNAELDRIKILRDLDKSTNAVFDWKYAQRGSDFLMFKDILRKDTKEELLTLLENKEYLKTSELEEYLNSKDLVLLSKIQTDITNYFNKGYKADILNPLTDLITNKKLSIGFSESLLNDKKLSNLNIYERFDVISRFMFANTFINNVEAYTIFYGNVASFEHTKQEANKRIAGAGSTGNIYRTDKKALSFINNLRTTVKPNNRFSTYAQKLGVEYDELFDGTMNTAVLQDETVKSDYAAAFEEILGSKKASKYTGKEESTNAQGYITFDKYRELNYLKGTWSNDQDVLYNKILNSDTVNLEDILEFFPVMKDQYYGPLITNGLPITAFHKYSLMPLIPSVIGENSILKELHDKLTRENIGYVTFISGSKVGTLSRKDNPDKYLNEAGNTLSNNNNFEYTKNTIHLKYLKNQVDIAPKFKKKVIFASQLRKLVAESLMVNGVPADYKINEGLSLEDRISLWNSEPKEIKLQSKEYRLLQDYNRVVNDLTEAKKKELLNEIGWEIKNGKPSGKLINLVEFVKKELTRQEIADYELDFLNFSATELNNVDFSLTPQAEKIEKLITSLVVRKLITQKVKGEGLIQVSSVGWQQSGFKKPDQKDILKYGTNGLRFYHKGKDGTVSMQVKIAIQGDFEKLLYLKEVAVYDEVKDENGKPKKELNYKASLANLNKLIKNETWLNTGSNRKMITMIGVRIPVQGHNSMEFMEVAEFLPKEAGNIIIPPIEIVVKSGSDFDVDKLNVTMPNLSIKDGVVKYDTSENTVKGLENNLINVVKDILALDSNFKSLITPNDTDIAKPEATRMASKSKKYNPFRNKTIDGFLGTEEKPLIAETKIFEYGYNLHSHTSNSVGKQALGLGAVDNTFNTLFNIVGMYMNPTRTNNTVPKRLPQRLLIPHRSLIVDNEKAISLSDVTDVNGVNRIADVISQLINGWVDVAKDPWIFNIQGNKEAAPKILFLVQAGVPFTTIVNFMSQPIIVEYIDSKIAANSLLSETNTSEVKFKIGEELGLSQNDISNPYVKISSIKDRLNLDYNINLDDDGRVLEEVLQNLIDDETQNIEPEVKKLYEQLIFLHYLEVEEMSDKVRAIKLNFNPDTTRPASLYELIEKEQQINKIKKDDSIPLDKIQALEKETMLKSFFIKDYLEAFISKLFPLRNNLELNNFIASDVVKNTLNKDDKEYKVKTFKNHLLTYIFQKEILEFDYTKANSFKGVEVKFKKDTEAKKINYSEFGVIVTKTEDKYTIYIDPITVKKLYRETVQYNKPVDKISDENIKTYRDKSYKGYFTNDKQFAEFLVQRELFRVMFPIETKYKDIEDKVKRVEKYEKWLKNQALRKTYNPRAIFQTVINEDVTESNNYAQRFYNIKNRYPKLVNDYKLVEILNINEFRGYKNLTLKNVQLTKDLLQVLNYELNQLKDPTVKKVENVQINRAISEFFEEFEIVALLQSGFISGTQFTLTRLVNPQRYLDVLNPKVINKYIRSISDNQNILTDYNVLLNRFFGSRTKNYSADFLSNNTDIIIDKYITIKDEYRGKVIYLTPGSGKTTFKSKNPLSVIDADDITIEEIYKVVPEFKTTETTPQGIILDFSKKYSYKNDEVKERVRGRLKEFAKRGYTVLTGSLHHLPVVDLFFTITNEVQLLKRFKTLEELRKYQVKELEAINKVLAGKGLEKISEISATSDFISEIKVVSPDYGVVKVDTNPTKVDTQEIINLIAPQIQRQAYKENVGVNANWQFSFGRMWSRVNLKAKPLLINSFAGVEKTKQQIAALKKAGLTVDKSKYIYDYHELDQNGNPLPPISDLQPLIDKIQNALGLDMSDYDSILGNIYLDNQSIAPHRDTTEAKSAKGYPVVVYTIGNNSGLGIWDDNKGKITFQGAYKEDYQGRKPTNEIATKDGTIYTFGMDGKGRFALSHTTPLGNIKKNPYPPIKLSDGRVITNYTITLTFRRAADLEPGIPATPAKLTTQPQVILTAEEIYSDINKDNLIQSENVILPKDLEENTEYTGKNFWNDIVPEAKSMFDYKFPGKKPMLIAYRGNKKKTFLQNYKDGNTVGNPFDFADETGTRKEQGIKSTKKFIEWMITGNNFGNTNATKEYRQAIINDIKSSKIIKSPILYYEEKNYATHATALDYLINKYDWGTEVKPQEEDESESVKIISQSDIDAYNQYVEKSDGKMPKEFFTTNTRFKEFYNKSTGKREKAPQSSKWILQDNDLYNLVDKETGEVYISNVDLKTGMKMTSKILESNPLVAAGIKINIYAGTGENAELSNFAIRPFIHLGINFDSVEQAFQYYKTEFSPKNENNRAVGSVIKDTKDGKRLRELGKEFKGLDQKVWDNMSPTIMKALLKDSFQQNPDALAKLLATGNAELTHKYNGIEQDKGRFSKLLMEVRGELKSIQFTQPSVTTKVTPVNVSPISKIQSLKELLTDVSTDQSIFFDTVKPLKENIFEYRDNNAMENVYSMFPGALFLVDGVGVTEKIPNKPNVIKFDILKTNLKDVRNDKGILVANPKLKTDVDNFITQLREDIQDKSLMLSSSGYGQSLNKDDYRGGFLYLSNELLKNFGYYNPGFIIETSSQKLKDIVTSQQPVSDQDVISNFVTCFK